MQLRYSVNNLLLETIPLTILGSWLRELDSELTDCIAATSYMPMESSEVLQEKAVASIALSNNIRGFTNDIHGFSNVCLIMNDRPAAMHTVADVSPAMMNYAIWEMKQYRNDIVLLPDVANYVIAAIETKDYVIPPEHLQFVGYVFKEKHRDYADRMEYLYEHYKTEDLEMNDFEKFHISMLMECDAYLEMKKRNYEYWSKQKLGDWKW